MPKTQEELLSSLKGQTVVIPHLDIIFRNWPSAINSERATLTLAVDERLQNLVPEKVAGLRKADFALFACCWWPNAQLPKLRILAYLAIWLFLWDDEIDQTSGTLSSSFEAAQCWRDATVETVTYYLGLGEKPSGLSTQSSLIKSFSDIGQALCAHYTLAQRWRFLDEVKFFLRESQKEQEIRLAGKLGTVEQYWNCRMGTSAVGVCLAMIEYADDLQLPLENWDNWDNSRARTVWHEINVIVSITNDVLSLKKELAEGCVYSLIPLSCAASSCTAQDAVDRACNDLRSAIEKCDFAAALLLEECSIRGTTQEQIRHFLQSARMNCTGNYTWSSQTGRYALTDKSHVSPSGIGFAL